MKNTFLHLKLLVFLLFIITGNSFASIKLSEYKFSSSEIYIIRLNNGDIITGSYIEDIDDENDGDGIKLKTELGNAFIFESQIEEISVKDEYYRHSHRVFLLPTADPIGSNHFAGVFELLFFYAGFGISDFASVTFGRSVIPGIPSFQQISVINTKFTIMDVKFDSLARYLKFAVGVNFGWANSRNRIINYYGVTTVHLSRTSLSASVFMKTGSEDYYTLNFDRNSLNMFYPDYAIGLGLGLDSRLPKSNDIHFIGEIWNNDITRPTNTGVLLGIRLSNHRFSADFGLSFFTQPFIAPFTSFTWTPF